MLAVMAASALLIGVCSPADAAFPEKTVRVIIPFGVGGGNDISARLFAKYWEKELGVSVVCTNITGAAGLVAEQETLKAKPDGYTILWQHHKLLACQASGISKYGWEEFTPVFTAMTSPFCVFGNKDLSENTIQDLLNTMKTKPGTLSYAYQPLSNTNFYFVDLMHALGVDPKKAVRNITNINNDQPRLINVMQGNVSFTMNGLSSVLSYVRSGDVKIFAMGGKKRNPQLPDVKTLVEQGFDATLASTDFYALAPKGVPADIVKILQDSARKVAADPKFIEEAAKLGLVVSYVDGEEFKSLLKEESTKLHELAQKYGVHK